MNKTSIFTFILGAGVGSAITWAVLKSKYDRILDEELKSMDEYYTNKLSEEAADEPAKTEEQPEAPEYNQVLDNHGYSVDLPDEDEPAPSSPYVISPAEFGEIDGYGTKTLIYYADNVLTDDTDSPIDDVDSMIGDDSLNHIGDYGDDFVMVRNDSLKTDIEVWTDPRKFSEVRRNTQRPTEEE